MTPASARCCCRWRGGLLLAGLLVLFLVRLEGSVVAQIASDAYPITFGEDMIWYNVGDDAFGGGIEDAATLGVRHNFRGFGSWRIVDSASSFESNPIGIRSQFINTDLIVHTLFGDPQVVVRPSGASTSLSMALSFPFYRALQFALLYYEVTANNDAGRTVTIRSSGGFPTALDGWKFPGPSRTRVFFSSNGDSFLDDADNWVIFSPAGRDYVSFGLGSPFADPSQFVSISQILTERSDTSYTYSITIDLQLNAVGVPVGILIPIVFSPPSFPSVAFQNTVNFLSSEDSLLRDHALQYLGPDRVSRIINYDFECLRRPDVVPPQAICPPSIVAEIPVGTCAVRLDYASIIVTDNCPRSTISQVLGPVNGTTVTAPGIYPISFTITDVGGNIERCDFQAEVIDIEFPIITCPSDIRTFADPDICSTRVSFSSATATDNCAFDIDQTFGPKSGSIFPVGYHLVYFAATDPSSNTAVCSMEIAVIDDQDPKVECRSFDVVIGPINWEKRLFPEEILKSRTDNCGFIDDMFANRTSINYLDAMIGSAPVLLTVTDYSFNSDSCETVLPVSLSASVIRPFVGQPSAKEGTEFEVQWYDVGIFSPGDTIRIWITDENDVFVYELSSSSRYIDFSGVFVIPRGTVSRDNFYFVHGDISGTGDSGSVPLFIDGSS